MSAASERAAPLAEVAELVASRVTMKRVGQEAPAGLQRDEVTTGTIRARVYCRGLK